VRTGCIVAALWPERCRALVAVSGYLIGSRRWQVGAHSGGVTWRLIRLAGQMRRASVTAPRISVPVTPPRRPLRGAAVLARAAEPTVSETALAPRQRRSTPLVRRHRYRMPPRGLTGQGRLAA
jgi:hypothetical protein